MDDSDRNPISALDPDDLIELENRLAAWRPSVGTLDQDRLLYRAGYAAARADGRAGIWRFATAALIFVSLGLSGLAVHERSLLLHERAERLQLMLANAPKPRAGTLTLGPTLHEQVENPLPLEPFAPSSYFALTSRLAQGDSDLSAGGDAIVPERNRPRVSPIENSPLPMPLRARDVQRVLDL